VSWHILFAPGATPKEIIDRLHREMRTIMSTPEMKQRAATIGLLPLDSPPIEGIRAYIRSEQEKWGALVTKLGLAGTL
jgi:tripartite-type tricarboxylate transporter receptor subunit TctC